MKIQFVQACKLELIGGINPDNGILQIDDRIFNIGEIAYVDLVRTNDDFQTATIEFNDGRVSYGVPQMTFEVID